MKRQQAHIQTRVLVAGALAALIFILSGCAGPSDTRVVQKAPVVRPEVKKPQPETSRPATIQPALNTISSRIRSYEVRLEEIKAIENSPSSMMIPQEQMGRLSACKSELLDILTNYDALQKRLLQETDLDTGQRLTSDTLLQVNQQDMQFLEGGCGRLLADLKDGQGMGATPPSGATQYESASPAYGAPDPQIQKAFAAGDYARVISLYNQQWTAMGQQAAPTTTYQYSQALLKNYQFKEAEQVLANLNTQLRQQGGIAPRPDVLRSLGDIAFSAGRYQDAQQRYEELVRLPGNQGDSWTSRQLSVLQLQMAAADELSAYATLVRNYLAYTPSRDGYAVTGQAEEFLSRYPASRLVANVNAIHKSTREEADAWLNRGVQRIEQQVGQQPQPDTADTVPAAPPVSVETGAQSTTPQAPLSPEQLAARDQALQEQYDRGVAQMAAKEYDQALQTFATLLGTNFDANARERINDTASLAGEDNRQKAAELFVRASQTQDLETRKKLLLASRQLLLDVPVKYPQAGLNSKVERNLASVERALQAIDPSLLKASSGAGGGTSSNLP